MDAIKSFLVFQENGGVGKITLYEAIESSFPPELAIKSQWNPPESSWVSSVSLGNPNLFLLRRNTETVIYQWVPPTPPLPVGTIKGHAYGLRRADNHAYLIASLSGRDEVWLLDLKKKKLLKTIAVSGGINQFAPSKKRFWVSSYEHGGFDLATANPVSQKIESELSRVEVGPLPVNENGGFEEKEYSPLPFLLPRTWIPSALFLPFGFQAGAWIPMFDLSQKHFYDLNMGIDQRNTNEGSKTLPYLSGLYGYRFGNSSSLQSNVYFSPGFLIVSRSFFQRWGASLSYAQKLGGLPIQGKVSALMRKIEPSDLGPANQSIGLGLDLSWGSRSKTGPLDADSTEGIRFSIGHQQFLKGCVP
ncbi:hypothetical protein EBT16_06875 [bacterium]|nr:hypothetical protein [bacterium]